MCTASDETPDRDRAHLTASPSPPRGPTEAPPPCPSTQEGTTQMDGHRLLTAKLTAGDTLNLSGGRRFQAQINPIKNGRRQHVRYHTVGVTSCSTWATCRY